ncbi:hypothetical protein ASG03_14715 [Rhizobium sp. Leaf341]|nr:hypothetical protein ASG03_14715 [Rhizobium sp. Leaf341]
MPKGHAGMMLTVLVDRPFGQHADGTPPTARNFRMRPDPFACRALMMMTRQLQHALSAVHLADIFRPLEVDRGGTRAG